FLLEFNVLLTLGYLFFRGVLWQSTRFQWNRAYLLALIPVCLFLPAMVRWVPSSLWSDGAAWASFRLDAVAFTEGAIFPGTELHWSLLLLIGYGAGVLWFFGRFMLDVYRTWRLIRHATARQKERDYTRVTVSEAVPPFSIFRYLCWNTSLQGPDADLILAHELVHIRERHSLDVLLFAVLRIVCWFNPFSRALQRAVRLNHEYIADQAAWPKANSTRSYCELLFKHAVEKPTLLGHPFARPSLTRLRIRMVQQAATNRSGLRYFLLVPMMAVLVLVSAGHTLWQPDSDAGKTVAATTQMPVFPGGTEALYRYFFKEMDYPKAARKAGVEGKVFVQFTVATDGAVEQVKLKKGIGYGCDEEAVRVVRSMPQWQPARSNGQATAVTMTLPIRFARE
ncbi:MAG: M56 family metallopeptidase, partial [Bacteroidota bacterium]